MMTGLDHYAKAQELLKEAISWTPGLELQDLTTAVVALVHAQLAAAAPAYGLHREPARAPEPPAATTILGDW